MSSRSKSSSSSIQSNGNTSRYVNNCIRSSQPPITRPHTSYTLDDSRNNSGRSNQYLRSSQPSKKSNYTSNRSSLNTHAPINQNRIRHTPTNSRRGHSSFGIKSYINDSTCISLRQQLMDNDDPSEIYDQLEDSQLQKLVTHIKEYEQENALSENYIEASKSRNLILEIHEILKIRKKNEINDSFFATSNATNSYNNQNSNLGFDEEEDSNILDHYSKNYSENMNDLDENEAMVSYQMKKFDQLYQEKIKKYERITDEKIDKLKECHQKQKDDLEKLWKEKKPVQYRKPSGHLLQLKTIEKNLAMTGDYERAMILHKETESLTKKEMIDAQKRLVNDYKIAKTNLLAKQKTEFNQLQQSRNDGLIMLQNQHKLKRQKYENRDKVLQQQKSALASKKLNQASQSFSLPAPLMTEKLGTIQYNLLPELTPPNDTDYVKEEERKAREENKRRLVLQKRNIDAISQIYKVKPEYENTNSKQESDAKTSEDNEKDTKEKETKKIVDETLTKVTDKEAEDKNNEKEDVENDDRTLLELAEHDDKETEKSKSGEIKETNETKSQIDKVPNAPEKENKEELNIYTKKSLKNGENKEVKTGEEIKEQKTEEVQRESNLEADTKTITSNDEEETEQNFKEISEAEQKQKETNSEEDKKENKLEEKIKDVEDTNPESIESQKDTKAEEENKEKEIKSEKEEENKTVNNKVDQKETKSENNEDKKEKEIKSESNENEIKSELDESQKEKSYDQHEDEKKSLLDLSVMSSLIGSADPKSHENDKEEDK